ncbi:hypothetical protein O181_055607 [Austropuccinia psidii MF-1]|uniref:Chromatin modification-related protein EAF3 n=1 Tax=Austropuccinia psidii MF-1 TaxID=1389203 RepID=A0A9Q3HTM6_9BASI|nr:hypothetical protein [Austropuccinia psidii MF-1]
MTVLARHQFENRSIGSGVGAVSSHDGWTYVCKNQNHDDLILNVRGRQKKGDRKKDKGRDRHRKGRGLRSRYHIYSEPNYFPRLLLGLASLEKLIVQICLVILFYPAFTLIMVTKLAFSENERVLCYHGPLIYEAKILKIEECKDGERKELSRKGPEYWVHYKGWKQSWDEWVPESRLLKFSEENLRKQRELNEARRLKDIPEKSLAKDIKSMDGRSASIFDKGKKSEGRGTKRSRDVGGEAEEDTPKRPCITILFPEALKLQLVDDWEAVTRKNQVVTLPRNPTVKTLFEEYEQHAIQPSTSPQAKNLMKEVLAGLKVYFDRSLGHSLLYRNERQQYIEIRKKSGLEGKTASEIYGAEHLLRLFVNLPEMISHTNMEPEVIGIVREHIANILDWLVLEQKRVFQSPYDVTSPAYQNINRAM